MCEHSNHSLRWTETNTQKTHWRKWSRSRATRIPKWFIYVSGRDPSQVPGVCWKFEVCFVARDASRYDERRVHSQYTLTKSCKFSLNFPCYPLGQNTVPTCCIYLCCSRSRLVTNTWTECSQVVCSTAFWFTFFLCGKKVKQWGKVTSLQGPQQIQTKANVL